jgi:hypothetical protein
MFGDHFSQEDKNARLRAKIEQALTTLGERLPGWPMKCVGAARVGDSAEKREQSKIAFIEEERVYLEKKARALIARRPELEADFNGLF